MATRSSPPPILFTTIPCSTRLRYGDLLKLFVPVGWAFFGFLAMMAYMLAPLGRGDAPRWGTMVLVLAAIVPGVGAAVTVWKHHRYEVYTELSASLIAGGGGTEQELLKFRDVQAALRCEAVLALFVVVASMLSMLFFAAVAPGMNACAHATCGADVSWSALALCGAIIWVVAIRLALLWSNKASVNALAAQLAAVDGGGGNGGDGGGGEATTVLDEVVVEQATTVDVTLVDVGRAGV
jgi:hypothetical protein